MRLQRVFSMLMAWLVLWSSAPVAWADPCGMAPPIWLGDGSPLQRIGVQQTYVFYKGGIESFVIRPGFTGKVDEFGMLIPFPTPPAIRKVGDDVFPHVAAAIDPPEVVVDLRPRREAEYMLLMDAAPATRALGYKREAEEVTVLRREAVGMYEVAVLEAGSAQALKRWMDDQGFRYPDGMDVTCEEYVEQGWCFVAIKARVGNKAATEPRPGMREVDAALPPGASFDGHVQAMGFRFRTDELVLPMRLSAFNEGELRNVVYILTEGPRMIRDIPVEHVVRQISGYELYHNLVDPLPLRILGGSLADVPEWRRNSLPAERDPNPHNGIARGVIASDLLAVRTNRLAHPFEEEEKVLLEIGERLGLRGPELDALHAEVLRDQRETLLAEALADLYYGMTMTVVDGDFPREVLARDDLRFTAFHMPATKNSARHYDAKFQGPAPVLGGTFGGWTPPSLPLALVGGLMLVLCAWILARIRPRSLVTAAALAGLWVVFAAPPSHADHEGERLDRDSVQELLSEAVLGEETVARGWAIVALAEQGGLKADVALELIADWEEPGLVRTWALAGRIKIATSSARLLELSRVAASDGALARPLRLRWLELSASSDDPKLFAQMLEAMSLVPDLTAALTPALLAGDSNSIARALLTGNDPSRRLAASFLAAQGAQGREGIGRIVADVFRFDPAADEVPWEGAALFLPSIAWSKDDGRDLVGSLVAWHLWCERHEMAAQQTQIHNNLRSLGLAQAVGYASPGWNEVGTDEWLRIWGQAVGREALRKLLAAQGVAGETRYRAILETAPVLETAQTGCTRRPQLTVAGDYPGRLVIKWSDLDFRTR